VSTVRERREKREGWDLEKVQNRRPKGNACPRQLKEVAVMHYMELDPQFPREVEVFRLALETEFRKLREDESLLWVAAGPAGEHDVLDATSDLPDTIILSVVPPFPGNSSLVICSPTSSKAIQQRLARSGWERTSPKKRVELRRYIERHKGRYWRLLPPEKQERIIAEEVAAWEETKRKRDEDERYLASLKPEQREREEKRRDDERLAAMKPLERKEELRRRRIIHFGTLRIPPGEMVKFTKTDTQYMVASGAGKPENGGTILSEPGKGLFSIEYLTRLLMGKEFDKAIDVWSLWEYKSETLRSIFKRYFPEG
jgi:hypothetical protein